MVKQEHQQFNPKNARRLSTASHQKIITIGHEIPIIIPNYSTFHWLCGRNL